MKPSEIFRQKSSDSLEVKVSSSSSRKEKSNALSKSSDLLADEFGKKLAKSESLKSTQSSSGSLGSGTTKSTASPTGSLDKLAIINNSQQYSDSPTGSLGKIPRVNLNSSDAGSKESLQGHPNNSAGKIKSFESISSLSSDSMKISQNIENEPYYDTVPVESNEGDYVYIQPNGQNSNNNTGTITSTGTTGSSSSRDDISSTAGSTLPLTIAFHHHHKSHTSSQNSVIEPESPGKCSNYVNIDYFLR